MAYYCVCVVIVHVSNKWIITFLLSLDYITSVPRANGSDYKGLVS